MLAVLFDKNVPYPLRHHLIGCEVKTAEEEGWDQILNGELIRCAEAAGYRVLLTCDQNLGYQQNMLHRQISTIVLGSNIWPSVRAKVKEIVAAFERVSPGSFEFIEIAPPQHRRRLGGSSK
ncbi:MAG TPA: hypothetical protein VHU83_25345 [Bryobacteraceae bacterium]|jgi:hypothetical protein|nr:hypothetical protein [Bryobacteraceae bacterium]